MDSKNMLGNGWKAHSLVVGALAMMIGAWELYISLTGGSIELFGIFAMDAQDPGTFTWWRAIIYVPAGIMFMGVALRRVDRLDGQGRMVLAAAMIWLVGIMDLFGILMSSVLADEESADLFISSLDALIENLSGPYPFSLGFLVLTVPIVWMAVKSLRSETVSKVTA